MQREVFQAPTQVSREVLAAWADRWSYEGVVIDLEKPLPPKESVMLPRRWAVERTFVLLSHNRKLSLGTTKVENTILAPRRGIG